MTILETERLRLRELRRDDFDELHAMFNDPLVMRYYPGLRDAHETQEWLDRVIGSYEQGYMLWAIELAATGSFLGWAGLLVQDVDGQEELEVGYMLKSQCWHNGYATEAARACKEHAFRRLGRHHVISLIRPANRPSCAVAERNGMSVWKTTIFRGSEALVYRVDATAQERA
jgi:RimJ/RimL family protein N-acetyltransferase